MFGSRAVVGMASIVDLTLGRAHVDPVTGEIDRPLVAPVDRHVVVLEPALDRGDESIDESANQHLVDVVDVGD